MHTYTVADVPCSTDSHPVVSSEELIRRTIRRSDYVSCNEAFIDCRIDGSDKKENYSIVGGGVSQSGAQVVNLREPHGFNVGAAAMPNGVTNNLHLHYTAEVFLNFRGEWRLRWGAGGGDGELLMRTGDIATLPTWIFRGFTNEGSDAGWLFTILGCDETGGIVWDPSIVAAGARHGLYIGADNRLLDVHAGDVIDATTPLLPSISEQDLRALRNWTGQEMAARVVSRDRLSWSSASFLCSVLPGGRAQYAQVIGYGMTESRHDVPPVHNPHGFSVAWLRASTGEGLLTHRQQEPSVYVVYSGRWRVTLNRGSDEVATEIGPDDTISIPSGAWRRLEALSDGPAELVVVHGGDARVRLEWDLEIRRRARSAGLALDAGGYLGSAAVIAISARDD